MAPVVGYRFHPTEEELLEHYLSRKIQGGDTRDIDGVISTVDFCCIDPVQLPEKSKIKSNDNVWYFFGIRKYKYNTGKKQNRTTSSGFWKKTGDTLDIIRNRGADRDRVKIGEKKVLVFHLKNRGGGKKTGWIMHEYTSPSHMEYSICKIKFRGKETEMNFNPGNEVVPPEALPMDTIAEGLSRQENIDMPLNPTDVDIERNKLVIIPMDTDPVFDCLEDLQGVDLKLDDSSNEQPYNNPLIHTMPFNDDIEEFLFGEELNEQDSKAPLAAPLNLNGDMESLAFDWEVPDHMLDNGLNEEASNVPLVEDVQIDWEEINNALNNAVDDKWRDVLDHEISPMQQDLNDYNRQQSLAGVCVGYESDANYDWICSSMTASSSKRPRLDLPGTTITSWSASDCFASSSHRR